MSQRLRNCCGVMIWQAEMLLNRQYIWSRQATITGLGWVGIFIPHDHDVCLVQVRDRRVGPFRGLCGVDGQERKVRQDAPRYATQSLERKQYESGLSGMSFQQSDLSISFPQFREHVLPIRWSRSGSRTLHGPLTFGFRPSTGQPNGPEDPYYNFHALPKRPPFDMTGIIISRPRMACAHEARQRPRQR